MRPHGDQSTRFLSRPLPPGLPVLLLAVVAVLPKSAVGQPPRILPPDKLPNDQRLQPLRDLNAYFPFAPPATADQWKHRSLRLRRDILVSLGLWPMPAKTPLHAVVHGRIEMDDYTIEKVYFESAPGFYVTGNLYRPQGRPGKKPGVLCPHGHWASGRFHDAGLEAVGKQIEQGAERFEDGGRSPLQSRCVQLARMGCVVLHYDMIGYADSTQISFAVAHRFAKQRPEMNRATGWGLFSPQAESRLQSVMGLQTYNSIRALDFLTGLPDVDPDRIAVTGASGGGTQTFMLCAVDPRPAVAFPAVMVSTAMQGGCTCENACLLRIGTGNVEFAALFAPKPLGLTAADDWTVEMETKGFPQLQQLYQLLGAADNVMLAANLQFGHNYNYVSRRAMYGWLNKHLKLGLPEPIVERPYRRLTDKELTVWDSEHAPPEGGPDFERRLLAWWTEDAEQQLQMRLPGDEESLPAYRQIVGGGVEAILGEGLPDPAELHFEQIDKTARGDYLQITGLLQHKSKGAELPLVWLQPQSWKQRAVIWIHQQGKTGLFTADGQPNGQVQRLIDAGAAVVGVDLLFQGEFLKQGQQFVKTRRVSNSRESSAYTFGYNPSLFAQRVHDVLSVITFVRHQPVAAERVYLIGLGDAGPWAAAARAQARDVVSRAAIDTGGFRFGGIRDLHDVNFLPGGAKYHDLPGMLALAAPHPLWLAGEGNQPPPVTAAVYRAAGGQVDVFSGKPQDQAAQAVAWLLRQP